VDYSRFYDSVRQRELHFPLQENVWLAEVANGSLWDPSTRSFIRSIGNHPNWDALVFRARDPTAKDALELEAVVLLVLYLEQLMPMIVLFSERDDGVYDALENAARMSLEELMSFPKLREKIVLAVNEAERREELEKDALEKLPKRFPLSPWGMPDHRLSELRKSREEEIRFRSWSGDALKTKTSDQKWSIIAKVEYKHPPQTGPDDIDYRIPHLTFILQPLSNTSVESSALID
jgi:hypothetical protein